MKTYIPKAFRFSILSILAILLLFPFVVLAFFNVPSSDDFAYALWQRDMGTITANLACYYGWGGRYFSNLLLTAANPLAYSTNYKSFLIPYQLHSIAMLLFLSLSFFHLFRRVTPKTEGLLPFSIFVLAFHIFFLKDSRELLFWMAGSYTYCYGLSFALMALFYLTSSENKVETDTMRIFPNKKIALVLAVFLTTIIAILWIYRKKLLLFLNPKPELFLCLIAIITLFALLLPFFQTDAKRGLLQKYSLVALCSFLAIGSNEIFAFLLLPFFGIFLVFQMLRNMKIRLIDIVLLAISTIAAALNLLAPSTFARQKLQSGSTISFNAFDLPQLAGLLSYFGYFIPFSLLVFSVYLFFFNKTAQKNEDEDEYSIVVLTIFSIISIVYLLVIVPVGLSYVSGSLPDRAKSPLVILATFPLLILAEVIVRNYPTVLKSRNGILISGISFLLMSYFYFPFSRTWKDSIEFILSDNAQKSISTHKKRFEEIANCQSDSCIISKNSFHPLHLLNGESAIQDDDPASWKNYKNFSYAAYFGKKTIIAR